MRNGALSVAADVSRVLRRVLEEGQALRDAGRHMQVGAVRMPVRSRRCVKRLRLCLR